MNQKKKLKKNLKLRKKRKLATATLKNARGIGVIVAADIKGADANNAGLWLELDAILAVVIGGNSLLGGRFSILASLIGALIIQSVNSVILLSGMPPEFNLVIKALLILAILVIQSPRISYLMYMLRASGPQPQPDTAPLPKTQKEEAQ